jgi:hypothetical protein
MYPEPLNYVHGLTTFSHNNFNTIILQYTLKSLVKMFQKNCVDSSSLLRVQAPTISSASMCSIWYSLEKCIIQGLHYTIFCTLLLLSVSDLNTLILCSSLGVKICFTSFLKLIWHTQNYWVFGLFPSSGILENTTFRKLHLFPSSAEGGGKDTYSVGPLRKS